MQTLSLPCTYCGKLSTLTIKRGNIDIVFTVGKAARFDSFSDIYADGDKITFHGLYFGDLMRVVEINKDQAKQITDTFKVRVDAIGGRAWFWDHSVTEFKIVQCGNDIAFKVLLKKAASAKRFFDKKYNSVEL